MDNDPRSTNTFALLPVVPGQPSDIASLSSDCQGYSVMLKWSGYR
jgi:hypothetical protein